MGKSEESKQREEKRGQVVEVHRFMGDWKGKAKSFYCFFNQFSLFVAPMGLRREDPDPPETFSK